MPLWIKIHEEDDVNQCLAVLRERQAPPEDMTIQISYWLGYGDRPREWFLENCGDEGKTFDRQWRHDASGVIGNKGDANIRTLLPAIRACKLPLHIRVIYANIHERELLQLVRAVLHNNHITGLSVFGNPGNDSEQVQASLQQVLVRRKLALTTFNNEPLPAAVLEERQRIREAAHCLMI